MTEISQEAVEALAEDLYNTYCEDMEYDHWEWADESDAHRNGWRDKARSYLVPAYPAIQAQVLAGVKEALKLRISEHEAIATRKRGSELSMEATMHRHSATVLREFLATLNLREEGC